MAQKKISYPFSPKSTKPLIPGQFWAIPLSDGRFGCGRVVSLQTKENGTIDPRVFLAGLLDWVGLVPPTGESIAGCVTIDQGQVHIATILKTGGSILGYRPLDDDSIEPGFFLSQSPGKGCMLQQGFEILRPATAKEQAELQTFKCWGYNVITIRAESHFTVS